MLEYSVFHHILLSASEMTYIVSSGALNSTHSLNQILLRMLIKSQLLMCTSVVGNKNDDPDHKVVVSEDAKQFADQMGIELFETSAKENVNVEEVSYVELDGV